MIKDSCKTCASYKPEPQEDRTGLEWKSGTGWCTVPRLHAKRLRTHENNWCDRWSESKK